MLSRIAPVLWIAVSLVSPSNGQTGSWLEVRTPHFVIVSNAPEKAARKAAHQFEGMRSVFQRVFPEADLDSGPPVLVLAVQDKSSLEDLEPTVYLGAGQLKLIEMGERIYGDGSDVESYVAAYVWYVQALESEPSKHKLESANLKPE